MKNKIFNGLLAAFICVSLCSCSNNTEQQIQSESQQETTEPETVTDYGEMRGLSAKELIAEMKTGWNL